MKVQKIVVVVVVVDLVNVAVGRRAINSRGYRGDSEESTLRGIRKSPCVLIAVGSPLTDSLLVVTPPPNREPMAKTRGSSRLMIDCIMAAGEQVVVVAGYSVSKRLLR